MSDDDQGRLVRVLHRAEDLVDLVPRLGVEFAGRFVGQHEQRLLDQGSGDGYALLLAAGELVRVMVEAFIETDLLE